MWLVSEIKKINTTFEIMQFNVCGVIKFIKNVCIHARARAQRPYSGTYFPLRLSLRHVPLEDKELGVKTELEEQTSGCARSEVIMERFQETQAEAHQLC
jgi:hypothetical protein